MKTKEAKIILTTKQETLDFLAAHDEYFDSFNNPVKSLWLCAELNRFEADSGYVYNQPAGERIMRENGLTKEQGERRNPNRPHKVSEGLLGTLIYLAQGYRREMKLEQDGWIRANQETLSVYVDKKCRAFCNGSLTPEIIAKVKKMGDRLRLCPPRTRTKAYAEYGDWWIKSAA